MCDIENPMQCYQCEQTVKPNGCTTVGVCTKEPLISAIQDLIVYGCAQIPSITLERTLQMIFMTLTNVNHNYQALKAACDELKQVCNEEFAIHYIDIFEKKHASAALSPAYFMKKHGADTNSLIQLGIQGIKGSAAYADHAYRIVNKLNLKDSILDNSAHRLVELLNYFIYKVDASALEKLLEVGSVNFKIVEILDAYNFKLNGKPELTAVSTKLYPGKSILITGHDLADLKSLLVAAEGKVNIYTHGEMLPAFMYPELKSFSNLKSHFGHAWQLQQTEFVAFPGPILFTTNCIMKPKSTYIDKCFTTGAVGYEGVKHIKNDDWSEIIEAAMNAEGFRDQQHCDQVENSIKSKVTGVVGFNHRVFDDVAGTLLQMIKDGKIKGFRFIGGCDGCNSKRNIFTQLAETCPKDKIVLTGACGRFKVNSIEMGDIEGIPRLLDVGQCNDIYSAIIILVKLASVLGCSVNDLPIELFVSWYEQKAIAQFLTLLSLGVKNIQLGPTAPVCITANIFKVLQEKFNVGLIE
ncbi:Hybrid_cluster protein 2 [Hexamita inflata]|uniref:Hybrid cluster protein 2 n=1 Tax=Hexamita inflata TaxID=28002 RepID=A0AA86NZM7_9EUKA|nr:Hybrid cluster protein 2 [Hexamita inflata]CAI9929037.1 Hybrid cluster protein 2 [Hexamita inflata]CAI9929039.1 Hybrid cluster protein 2 [Hexamita inflata]CAI9929041.1 Hybrid cluster protein 2 [Hexamita inflata]CAI9929043.1 Hybrid cluster protein 2 [Hexamita inflata]